MKMAWVLFIALLFVLAGLYNRSSIGRDSSDAPGVRSGLRIYRDAATGVQYVGTMLGGLTPRIDQQGKPYIGNEKE